MNPDYDPDWPEPSDRPRITLRERMRELCIAAVCYAVIVAASFLAPGCATTPDGDVQITVPAAAVDFATNAIREYLESHAGPSDGSDSGNGASSGSEGPAPSSGGEPAASATSGVALDFRFGGFRGGKAVEDSRCRISGLRLGKDSLSFRWDTKIPNDWKRESLEKGPMIVVAAFFWDGGKWVGGKFDWIDESRSSRSLENVLGGYGGWDGSSWTSAKRHAVCVVSADGKWRSNLLED